MIIKISFIISLGVASSYVCKFDLSAILRTSLSEYLDFIGSFAEDANFSLIISLEVTNSFG